MKKKIMFLLLLVFIGIQFVRIDKTVEPIDSSIDFASNLEVPSDVLAIMDVACMDCHSNQTIYPWYSNVAPVSWWMKKHIDNGRKKLNFSEWMSYDYDKRAHKIDEIIEVVQEKEMPLLSYWVVHWKAKLSDDERQKLVDYFSTLQ